MRIYKTSNDLNDLNDLKSINEVKNLIPLLVNVAQQEYNEWDENEDEYAGGGICHLIAEEMANVFNEHGVTCETISSNFEQHVYCLILVQEGIYSVDLPYGLYEYGGGYNWRKINGVQFDNKNIIMYKLTSDIEKWGEYVDENL